jgi:hypothetical protein
MMKKIPKHLLIVALIAVFVVLALGSMGSSPSSGGSYGGGGSSSGGGGSSGGTTVNVVFDNQSSHLVTVYIGGQTIQIYSGNSRSVSVSPGSTYEYHNSYLVRDEISSDGNRVTFRDR